MWARLRESGEQTSPWTEMPNDTAIKWKVITLFKHFFIYTVKSLVNFLMLITGSWNTLTSVGPFFHLWHEKNKKMYCYFRDTNNDDNEDDDDMFEEQSSFKGVAKSYRLNFAPGIQNLHARFQRAVIEAADELTTQQRTGRSLKYYLSLRCRFYKPTDPDTITEDPCVFNSETCTLLPSTSIKTQMEIIYNSIMQEVENFEKNGSGM